MRVVLDVNVWISGLLWGGNPGQLLSLARNQQIVIYCSDELLLELATTLKRAKFQKRIHQRSYTVEYLMSVARGFSECCVTTTVNASELRDPKDRKILEAALAANADQTRSHLAQHCRDLARTYRHLAAECRNPAATCRDPAGACRGWARVRSNPPRICRCLAAACRDLAGSCRALAGGCIALSQACAEPAQACGESPWLCRNSACPPRDLLPICREGLPSLGRLLNWGKLSVSLLKTRASRRQELSSTQLGEYHA